MMEECKIDGDTEIVVADVPQNSLRGNEECRTGAHLNLQYSKGNYDISATNRGKKM